MRWLSILRLRLRTLFKKDQVEQDLQDELQFHINQLEERHVGRGLAPAEARRAAQRETYGLEAIKDWSRDTRRLGWVEDTWQDIHHIVRTLVRQPAFAVTTILTLALGIGANTAIFSVVNSLSLRTLPVRQPERLALIVAPTDRSGTTTLVSNQSERSATFTNPIWEQVRRRADLFEGAFAWCPDEFNLSARGETDLVQGLWASGRMFETLGVQAVAGRLFSEVDDQRGGGNDGAVAVISDRFWQRRFGGAADVIGRVLVVERVPFTIIGVTPPDFSGPDVGRAYDVAIPLASDGLIRGTKESRLDGRDSWWLKIIVRLKADQGLDQGIAILRGLQPQIREATLPPDWPPDWVAQYLTTPFALMPAGTGESSLRRQYEESLLILLALVALVLVVACANLANLLMARAAARRHEWSVRLSLGASRWRLARLLLMEHLLIAGTGAVVGLILAQWTSLWLVRQFSSPSNPVFLDLTIDWRVLLFTAVVSAATVLLFGTAPTLRATRAEPIDALRGHGLTRTSDHRGSLSGGLVVVQVTLSLVLVVAAALLVRTFTTLGRVPLGFDRDSVLLVKIDAGRGDIPIDQRLGTYERIRQRVAAAPGVAAAGIARQTLIGGGATGDLVELVGVPQKRQALFLEVTPDWLATFGEHLQQGRDISARDTKRAAPVALVNQAFARAFLHGASPLGHSVRSALGNTPVDREIVGVVGDAVYQNLRESILPTIYVPLAQFDASETRLPPPDVSLSVRAISGSPATLAQAVAIAVGEVTPKVSLTFQLLSERVDRSLRQERLLASLSGFFGGLALLIAGLGLYGVTAYTVNGRRGEIGLRLALGSSPAGIVRLFVLRVGRLVTAGLTLGALASLWATRLISSLLFGVEPRDLGTLMSSALVLAAVAALAAGLPAWRASQLDPARVLREN